MKLKPASAAAEQFSKPGSTVVSVRLFGCGNINDTYLVTSTGAPRHFILQRLNRQVFPRPELVTANIRVVTEHFHERLRARPIEPDRRWELPRVLAARSGMDHWLDADGSCWRALSLIGRARSHRTIQNPGHATEVGFALGRLHRLMSDLDPDRLADTLPGFHVTPRYLQRFDQVVARPETGLTTSPEVKYCLRFIEQRRSRAGVLEAAKAAGKLSIRPIHGDPKVDNILIDTKTDRAVSIIDLDTVTTGLVHYDIGDCLRSACNPLGEDADQWESVRFEIDLARAILKGYLPEANHFLATSDRAHLYDAVHLIAFELGLRFLTDHLAGDVYFKVKHRHHNLQRALVQFRLCESIEALEPEIRALFRND